MAGTAPPLASRRLRRPTSLPILTRLRRPRTRRTGHPGPTRDPSPQPSRRSAPGGWSRRSRADHRSVPRPSWRGAASVSGLRSSLPRRRSSIGWGMFAGPSVSDRTSLRTSCDRSWTPCPRAGLVAEASGPLSVWAYRGAWTMPSCRWTALAQPSADAGAWRRWWRDGGSGRTSSTASWSAQPHRTSDGGWPGGRDAEDGDRPQPSSSIARKTSTIRGSKWAPDCSRRCSRIRAAGHASR